MVTIKYFSQCQKKTLVISFSESLIAEIYLTICIKLFKSL